MLEESRDRILDRVSDQDLVLDVGAWSHPFARADWVIDLQPYETRGLYGYDQGMREVERFTQETWVVRDICDREPWPFADAEFDFVVCSHTLEDVRDPVWVCQELQRVAKSGYIEVPSRLEEQTVGINGEWPGWAHHRWLCEIADGGIEFVHKSHALSDGRFTVTADYTLARPIAERRATLWWNDSFRCRERILMTPEDADEYLASGVPADAPRPRRSLLGALRRRLPHRTA